MKSYTEVENAYINGIAVAVHMQSISYQHARRLIRTVCKALELSDTVALMQFSTALDIVKNPVKHERLLAAMRQEYINWQKATDE